MLQYAVEPHCPFTHTREVIEQGISDRLHLGAQLYVSQRGTVLFDGAFGESREGVALTADTITLWFSAGKPLTAIVLAQLIERGRLEWTTRIGEVIPEFNQGGKESITVAHVLTHTAGLDALDPIEPALPLEQKLERIWGFALPLDWIPGERAAYSSTAGWYVLAALIHRITGSEVDALLRSAAFRDAGLENTRLRFGVAELPGAEARCAWMYDTIHALPQPLRFWNSDVGLTALVPGGGARGPIRELGKLYELLLSGGGPLLKRETVHTMTARQRVGIFDETFQFRTDAGYGFILNSNRDGMQMPYGYGRAASAATFGHSGNQSSCAFADPDRELVVAWTCNGMPGERKHQQRQRAINNAIYADLALAK